MKLRCKACGGVVLDQEEATISQIAYAWLHHAETTSFTDHLEEVK